MTVTRVRLEESPSPFGGRLGRHVEHDPRSRDFAFEPESVVLNDVLHKSHGEVLDQGDLGSCTGNASVGAINTEPIYLTDYKKVLHEADALSVYSMATTLDGFDGTYPPDDTGSTGLAAAKACVKHGYIKRYQHAFSLDAALAALQKRAVITGVNWYEGFDQPDADGKVKIAGQVRGGHEFRVVGYHHDALTPMNAYVEAINSWGVSWGKRGHFLFTVANWAQLLSEQGDVTVLLG